MPRRSQTPPQKQGSGRSAAHSRKLKEVYPSLTEGLTPAERLSRLLADAEKQGIRPLTAAEFDHALAMPSEWPAGEDLDEFLAWLRPLRREGR